MYLYPFIHQELGHLIAAMLTSQIGEVYNFELKAIVDHVLEHTDFIVGNYNFDKVVNLPWTQVFLMWSSYLRVLNCVVEAIFDVDYIVPDRDNIVFRNVVRIGIKLHFMSFVLKR